MMYSEKITFVLFMFNEEARVERAVRNFNKFGRVLIVDCFSTDRTCEMAVALGAEILKYQNHGWVEDEHTTSLIKATVKTPWIYWGFADEIVGRATMDEMISAVEGGKYAIVNIARKNYYYGEFCHAAYRNIQNRAFLKDAIDFKGNRIHHFGKATVPESSILYLDPGKHFVHHFISNTAKVYNRTIDSYSDIEAVDTPLSSPLKLLARMAVGFLKNYYIYGGRKAGMAGFYLGMQQSFYHLMIAMKVHEREHNLVKLTIEERNNEIRDGLLAQLERGDQQAK
jgi:glycosyltransferase involved in cell wall biosynthesis